MAITYAPIPERQGYDGATAPRWQMLPVGRQRYLRVAGSQGLIPRVRVPSGSPASLTVMESGTEPSHLLILTGIRAGRAYVEWIPPGSDESDPIASEGLLEVSVKNERVIDTAFHYVDGGLLQKTKRRIGDLEEMIRGANDLLKPQANVSLKCKKAGELRIGERLGLVVRSTSKLDKPALRDEWKIVTSHADASADFNVFFVKRFEHDDTPLVDDAEATTRASAKNCIFEDDTGRAASEILAHETLHLLGLGGHSNTAAHLIARGEIRTGTKITRDQANAINRSGT